MAITASMVKELRDSTGAGMMDAKKALTESGGDMEAAVDWLRTKGLAKAAKKSGRTAAEGLVALVAFFDVAGGLVDELEGELVALLIVIGPVDQAVLTHDGTAGVGVVGAALFKGEAELEAGAHPGQPEQVVAEDLFHDLGSVGAGGDGDQGVRVGVIDELVRHEGVQGGVDR